MFTLKFQISFFSSSFTKTLKGFFYKNYDLLFFGDYKSQKHLESFPLHLQTFDTPLTTTVALISSL